MNRISRLALLLLPALLAACGETTPLAGEWVPDIYETRRRWENLLLDRENRLAQQGEESGQGFGQSTTGARARIIDNYEGMDLRLTIHSPTAFSFTRRIAGGKRGRGAGRCEIDGEMIILHPEEGVHFLRGRERVPFLHREHRLVEVRLQQADMAELFPVLVLKRP